MNKMLFAALAAAMVTGFSLPAKATNVTFNYGNASVYGGANGTTNFSAADQGELFTMSSGGGKLSESAGTVFTGGIGVDGPLSIDDPHEIGFTESFNDGIAPPLLMLDNVYLNHLFAFGQAQYEVNGGNWVTVTQAGNNVDGVLIIPVNVANVSSIGFREENLFSTFTVGGLSAEVAPEPATLGLVGVALLGAGLLRRKRKV